MMVTNKGSNDVCAENDCTNKGSKDICAGNDGS